MSELQITSNFVKKLTKNIRETYGEENARYTDVMGLVANSFGWKTDAMMHALKKGEDNIVKPKTVNNVSKKSGATFVFRSVIGALKRRDLQTGTSLASVLSSETALHRLLLAFVYENNRMLFNSFDEDPRCIQLVGTAVGMDWPSIPEHQEFLSPFSWLERPDIFAWAAASAVREGYLGFESGIPIVINRPSRLTTMNSLDLSEELNYARRSGDSDLSERISAELKRRSADA